MSDKDQFDEQAERLLPSCFCDYEISGNSPSPAIAKAGHDESCPAYYRPALAATLRELGNIRALLIRSLAKATGAQSSQIISAPYTIACEHAKEIADLRAELQVRDNQITQLLATNDKWVIEIERLKAQLMEWEKLHGLK